ncbi:MAG: FG-GAP repeat domain-containing protein [Bryobacteraceae bacterium]
MPLLLLMLASGAAFASGPELAFREHVIATDLRGGYQVVAVDMNRDGKPDLLALASGMPELVWFENPTWRRHVIAGGFNRMINLATRDLDGDGIPEIVLAHDFANEAKNSIGTVSVLQHRGDPTKPWSVQEIDRLTTSHRLRWADIDGSGKPVVVNAPLTGAAAAAPEYRDKAPLVFYRPGEWKRETIGAGDEGVVHGIYIYDWDGDGREDVLTASFVGVHLHQLGKDGRWRRTRIVEGDPSPWPKSGSSDIAIGMLGRERFLASIEPWHGNQVVIYRRQGRAWKRQVIDDSIADGHTILATDLDGDGRDEVVVGFRQGRRSVYVYSSDGAKGWSRHTLDDGGISAAACAVADLNGDGRPDVACIGAATTNLKWYENLTPQAKRGRR